MVASIEQLRSSSGWRAYLTARACFRRYSPRNVLLILAQHPTATRVAGFRAWLNLGWCVTKGSTAIRIWAPCPPSKRQLKAWRDAGADPDDRPRTGWRLASVFAQDQVVELPPPARPTPLEPPIAEIRGDSHEDLIAEIGDFARFGHPPALAARRWICPSEYSSGPQQYRGHITLAGNRRARRLLIEAAWHYRHAPRLPAGGPPPDERAWHAQVRLHHRHRHLIDHGNRSTVANVAVARELTGFLWAAMTNQPLRATENPSAANHDHLQEATA